ncbi:MAG: DegT/DnrJ/EryC1/StrS family aminotransferase [Candidatus Taylorbacteria bacterium]|nr:DegT/DnrJ/EryC1/StrS family aminotransferase [Candidatus Taylorbacteria bacterium]
MKILFNKLNPQSTKESGAIRAAMQRVLKSGYYILGPEVKRFEGVFSKYVGTKHAIGVANGLEALQISLMALEIGPGDEVITTSLSAVATALAIEAVGAKAVFVDIDSFYHIDATKIEAAITPKTKVIIPVHLYGQSADINKIIDISKKRGLNIIEDCAQSVGTTFGSKKTGSFGTFGCFSFYPTKNLGAIGDGGLITTDDDFLAEKCRMMRNYGQKDRYVHSICGINSRLDELQAAILSEKMKHLDQNNNRRMEISASYKKGLVGIGDIKLPETREHSNHTCHLFVIKTDKRDALQGFLSEKGVETLIHYPLPIYRQPCFKKYNSIRLPNVENTTSKILSLPMHPYLTGEEIAQVCISIKSFYEKQ